jgi:hypothetical protein
MEDYYKWQIEQLRATIAQQDEIIRILSQNKLDILTENNRENCIVHSLQ